MSLYNLKRSINAVIIESIDNCCITTTDGNEIHVSHEWIALNEPKSGDYYFDDQCMRPLLFKSIYGEIKEVGVVEANDTENTDLLSGSEALFGFCGWLTTREEETIMSSSNDCSPVVDLISRFCAENSLREPGEFYNQNLSFPSDEVKENETEVSDTEVSDTEAVDPADQVEVGEINESDIDEAADTDAESINEVEVDSDIESSTEDSVDGE